MTNQSTQTTIFQFDLWMQSFEKQKERIIDLEKEVGNLTNLILKLYALIDDVYPQGASKLQNVLYLQNGEQYLKPTDKAHKWTMELFRQHEWMMWNQAQAYGYTMAREQFMMQLQQKSEQAEKEAQMHQNAQDYIENHHHKNNKKYLEAATETIEPPIITSTPTTTPSMINSTPTLSTSILLDQSAFDTTPTKPLETKPLETKQPTKPLKKVKKDEELCKLAASPVSKSKPKIKKPVIQVQVKEEIHIEQQQPTPKIEKPTTKPTKSTKPTKPTKPTKSMKQKQQQQQQTTWDEISISKLTNDALSLLTFEENIDETTLKLISEEHKERKKVKELIAKELKGILGIQKHDKIPAKSFMIVGNHVTLDENEDLMRKQSMIQIELTFMHEKLNFTYPVFGKCDDASMKNDWDLLHAKKILNFSHPDAERILSLMNTNLILLIDSIKVLLLPKEQIYLSDYYKEVLIPLFKKAKYDMSDEFFKNSINFLKHHLAGLLDLYSVLTSSVFGPFLRCLRVQYKWIYQLIQPDITHFMTTIQCQIETKKQANQYPLDLLNIFTYMVTIFSKNDIYILNEIVEECIHMNRDKVEKILETFPLSFHYIQTQKLLKEFEKDQSFIHCMNESSDLVKNALHLFRRWTFLVNIVFDMFIISGHMGRSFAVLRKVNHSTSIVEMMFISCVKDYSMIGHHMNRKLLTGSIFEHTLPDIEKEFLFYTTFAMNENGDIEEDIKHTRLISVYELVKLLEFEYIEEDDQDPPPSIQHIKDQYYNSLLQNTIL